MALVIFLLGLLPDYATFEGDLAIDHAALSDFNSSTFLNRNLNFWKQVFGNDFGPSRINRDQSVGEILRQDGRLSIWIFLISLSISIFLGASLGLFSAIFQSSWVEKSLAILGLFVTSLPSFLLVPILIYLFSLRWPIFPVALWEGPQSMILPIFALVARPSFFLARVFQEQLLVASKMNFISTARAKGLGRLHIWLYHVVPNSLTSFITLSGNLFGQLITGLFLVESLFALPGLGYLFIKSLAQRDYPVFLGLVLVFTLVLQLGHRLAELTLLKVGEAKLMEQEMVG